ncbi:hypothetical protein LX77_00670 [Gelidibacter algens]|uniref:Uncharacterized protein n=2 Tax=Gelidibacter algens TaxID=49280 RepID=A0A327SDG3_9FLAO|nr:hypothetical protein LX77_00670 [Gelidibacter algens]
MVLASFRWISPPVPYINLFIIIIIIMKINLLSCDAQRPDRRAISKCIAEFSSSSDEALSNELTDILLEGDAVVIEMKDKNSGSALRAFRKLDLDYEIIE